MCESRSMASTPSSRPDGLLADEGKLGLVARLGDDRRGGEDHRQSGHDQQHGGEEEPFIDAGALCHCFSVP